VLLLHGSPRALNEFIREDTAQSVMSSIARDSEADIVITAHAGEAFRRDASDVTFVGPGSVGGPRGLLGRAEYAVLRVGSSVEVDFRSVRYDPSEYLDAARAAGISVPEAHLLDEGPSGTPANDVEDEM